MNIHEYQAKDLFRKFNVATSEGKVFENETEAEEYAKSLNVDEYVVKAYTCLLEYLFISSTPLTMFPH